MRENKRVPIIGLRKPIELDWNEIYVKLNNYIKYTAGCVFRSCGGNGDTINSAEDLYQEGLILLYTCYEKYKYRSLDEFCKLYKASVWRLLREKSYKKHFELVEIETAYEVGSEDDQLAGVNNEYLMEEVLALLGDNYTAKRILQEYITPSDDTIREAEMDMNRKAMLKSLGHKLNVPKTIILRGEFVRRALGLSKRLFKEQFSIVQHCIYEVYNREAEIRSFSPNNKILDCIYNDDEIAI